MIAAKTVSTFVRSAVLILDHQRESFLFIRVGLAGPFPRSLLVDRHVSQFHWIKAGYVAFNKGSLITVAAFTPDEYSEAIEFGSFQAAGRSGPEPVMLQLIAILNIAKSQVGCDAIPFSVLRHLVGNRHVQLTRQYPTYSAVLSSH